MEATVIEEAGAVLLLLWCHSCCLVVLVEGRNGGGGGRILFTVYQKLSTEKTFYAILILILYLNLEILKRLFVNFCKSVFKSQNQKELEL